jgi:4-hydroxybenzoate polyprenyltransferase
LIYSLPLWPFPFAKHLRKAGFLKTTLLAFAWAYVTTIIPGSAILNEGWITLLTLFAARFFFMALLCIIFDTRDIKVDKMNSLRSLATDVSRKSLQIIMLFAFGCYIAAGVAVRLHFRDNSQLLAFLVTGLVVWSVYRASQKPQGYIFYYFVVDGLMLFSALATLVASLY